MTLTLDDLSYDPSHGWANYVKGVLHTLIKHGFPIDRGLDLMIDGNLPTASGLSSSASLEVLVGQIASNLFDLGLSKERIAVLAQEAENDYMGMHCGIMDQLSIAAGKEGYAMMMDTKTRQISYLPAVFEGYRFVIMNTHYQRKTTESKYNERREESMAALKVLKQVIKIDDLCQLSLDEFEAHKTLFKDPLIYRRAHHAVSEQDRVLKAKDALASEDAIMFGALLNQSHQSLKDDYDVTGLHLDVLTDAARTFGAVGARVTGAGFGGCAIALVPETLSDTFETNVNHIYEKKTGLKASFYPVTFTDGVREITDEYHI